MSSYGLTIGIVGLPNVGKSTLFNALLKKSSFAKASAGQAGDVARIGNYPFTTIEPNVGVVEVPDERLEKLADVIAGDPSTEPVLSKAEGLRMNQPPMIPAVVQFYDIAGLVAGASKGEGLGNKFLSHIKEVEAIIHVVRLFEDSEVIHVADKVAPENDIATIETELILADLGTLERQREPRGNATKEDLYLWEAVGKLKVSLDKGIPAREVKLTDEEQKVANQLNLLTAKPVLYVFNVSEEQLSDLSSHSEHSEESHLNPISIDPSSLTQDDKLYLCAKLESEIVALDEADQAEYLKQYGLEEPGLNRLIKVGYEMLGLISFLTAGVKEVRAWTIPQGTLAPQAAAVIHTDFERHFIKAEVATFDTFVKLGSWQKCREAGKVTLAGKDYVMKDGDVVDFKVGI